jgi:predicted enzyme related to lactoylglutathione lyase
MIKNIGCVEIPVSNMAAAVAFYEKVLGLKKTYEHPAWTSFNVGGTSFALAASGTKGSVRGTRVCTSCSSCVLRYAVSKMKPNKEAPTAMSVLYFEVENLDESYRKLRDQGVQFVAEPEKQGWGGRTAIMLDPDKNIIVLSQV